jgi:hypothetical protein
MHTNFVSIRITLQQINEIRENGWEELFEKVKIFFVTNITLLYQRWRIALLLGVTQGDVDMRYLIW